MFGIFPAEFLTAAIGASGYFVIGQFQAPLRLVFPQYHHLRHQRNSDGRTSSIRTSRQVRHIADGGQRHSWGKSFA